MKIGIIIGHESNRPGAKAVAPLNEHEYEYNTKLAEEMYRRAMELGLKATIFKRDGMTVESVGRFVNEWASGDNTVAIELHFNSSDNASVRGTETLYDQDNAADLAHMIQDGLCSLLHRTGKQNRGIKLIQDGDRGHRNLSSVSVPSVLVEPAFGSNKEDATLLQTNRNMIACCLVNVASDWLRRNGG